MSDYSTLIAASTTPGALANWAMHTSVQGVAPTIVQEAESYIYRRLRHWQMLTSTNGTMTTSQSTVAVPADFLEDKAFVATGTNNFNITRKTIQEVIAAFSYDGNGVRVLSPPQIFSNDKTNLLLDNPCDQSYPFSFWYYQQPTALGTTNTTNFLTTTYPRLLRTACMVGVSEFMKDAGANGYDKNYWENETDKEIDAAQKESDRHERSMVIGAILL